MTDAEKKAAEDKARAVTLAAAKKAADDKKADDEAAAASYQDKANLAKQMTVQDEFVGKGKAAKDDAEGVAKLADEGKQPIDMNKPVSDVDNHRTLANHHTAVVHAQTTSLDVTAAEGGVPVDDSQGLVDGAPMPDGQGGLGVPHARATDHGSGSQPIKDIHGPGTGPALGIDAAG